MSDEKMQVDEVIRLLNEAFPKQMRSAALYTWAAGNGNWGRVPGRGSEAGAIRNLGA